MSKYQSITEPFISFNKNVMQNKIKRGMFFEVSECYRKKCFPYVNSVSKEIYIVGNTKKVLAEIRRQTDNQIGLRSEKGIKSW